ncbi:uncharacterized protein LOC123313918 [Coccinella septempunctata]|uniref:uncharacterized protein LOC123313918 n=1 Tax=Coccinella septempunctata TaxID=41139 RepID=UPI001D09358D|nr:uncharacterized protein LOC123313918 [Coccinella septempunctata]
MNHVKVYCIALCLVLLSIFVIAHDTVNTNAEDPDCGKGPCGWAVYNRITRNIDFFMGNKCSCKPELNCTRDDDDISITAYVYRCKDLSKLPTNS